MQTIEDGPRGKELEPDNNPQAPVLQQPEYLAIGKSPSVRLTQPLILIPAVALPHGDSRKRNSILLIIKTPYGSCTGFIRPGIQ